MPVNGEKYYFISSLAKGLHTLELLVEQGELTVTQVARHFGSNRASSHRFLATLKTLGYVEKNSNNRLEFNYHPFQVSISVVRMPSACNAFSTSSSKPCALK